MMLWVRGVTDPHAMVDKVMRDPLFRTRFFAYLEANIACLDPVLGAAMDRQFENDIAVSERIERETWHRRPAFDKMMEQLFFKLRFFL